MRSVKVKVCGLTREKDLGMVVAAGVDAVGFIVGIPSSARNLTLQKAKNLVSQVPVFIDSVVVTTPKSIDWLEEVYDKLKPNAIQIHGKERLDISKIRERIPNTKLIKTIYVTKEVLNGNRIEELLTFDAILLDSFSKGKYGGTGKVHDWTLSKKIKKLLTPIPVILAGGLKPENVKQAILSVEPYAVDVASGVESYPGIKNWRKVSVFVENAKQIKLENN